MGLARIRYRAVKRVSDAFGAMCRDCEAVFTPDTNQAVPWSWRKSQAMHEKHSGHHMVLYTFDIRRD